MIQGMHGMFYTDEAKALREFIRDKLGLPDFSPASQDAAAVELIREAGAAFFTLLPEMLRVGGSWRYVAFGAIIVAMMIFRPEGIVTRTLVARLLGRRARTADAG